MVAEVEHQQVERRPAARYRVAVGVVVLVIAVAFVGQRRVRIVENGDNLVVVLKGVEETQHGEHQGVGQRVQQHCFDTPQRQQRQYAETHRQHQRRPGPLGLVRVADERRQHQDRVHHVIHRRHIGPLQGEHQFLGARVRLEPGPVVKGDGVGVIHVMAHVLVTQILVGAIAAPGEPVECPSQTGVVFHLLEQRVVGAVVHQVGGDHHGVATGQHAQGGQ